MKVSSSNVGEPFEPIEVRIVIESEEEARALYAIFNFGHNTRMLPDAVQEKIKYEIGERFYVAGGLIARGISYDQFYHSKR